MARANDIGIVAEEHPLCGAALVHMMETCLNFSKVLVCRNFAELGGSLGQYQSGVAVAVIHYDLPGMKQTAGLQRICRQWPSARILVTADNGDRDTILAVLSAGCHGLVGRNSPTPELEHALRAAAGGHFVVSPATAALTETRVSSIPAQPSRLTARQKEVLNLVAEGKSNKQIAWALAISEGTVKVHVNAAFRSLGVHNRVNATTTLLARSELAETA